MAQFRYLFKALIYDPAINEPPAPFKSSNPDIPWKVHPFYIIEQTQDDNSPINPGHNCFYEVLQRMDKVRAFALYDQSNNDEYLLDLHDGHFEVNQRMFKLHGDKELEDIRLVWFLRRQLVLNLVDTTIQSNDLVGYNFGFQCRNKKTGENEQFVMTLW